MANTKGICQFCGRKMTRGGMARHLRACPEREKAIEEANQKRGKEQKLYHLQIQDAWGGAYWLHLEMQGKATLQDLDRYLRAIWLECCGHLSEFTEEPWVADEIPMYRRIDQVFKPDYQLIHLYDFGTTSETLIKTADVRQGKPLTENPIVLMARNDPPEFPCMVCGKPATQLCIECVYEEDESGALCDEHAEDHPHTDYGEPMPLVNSPRVGMCGYCGPAEPSY